MPSFKNNDVELYYEVKGSGEAIVFTHGASWDHKQWQPQIEELSKQFKTIIWDVRGHGQSTLPKGRVDSESFSKDLIGLLDHLNIKEAHLCGLSMGGHISLQTAIRYPHYVKSLILIGTPFTNRYNWLEKVIVPINRWSSLFIPMNVLASIQATTLSKFNPDNKRYIKEVVGSIPLHQWIRIWNAVSRMESRDDLRKISCPTLILQGDHDTMTERQQRVMADLIPNASLTYIKNAHHATNLDHPEQVNNEILHHISQLNYNFGRSLD
ncbi:alpha/beta hydrolase [Alkalihalophilus lindianensis]|uniref:Alpha/beta hydrolase n=1 Tax=Alkalihalophilus lindianensis TaxID=1630542 RepID=A0ABU3XE42_9BACI|nr:alpha/beta hydrolase [Alkalihalophilus lindianensis]MDV2685578.1 alpha/beta hydrolase [Alkalihalophilus lindianensis]